MRVVVLSLLLFVSVQGQNVGDIVYYTSGGYAPEGTLCISACQIFADTRTQNPQSPYVGTGSPPNEPVAASNETWCATANNYSPTSNNKRKSWGYCGPAVTITAAPSVAPSGFTPQAVVTADGGGIVGEDNCVFGGIVKWTDENGTNQERSFSADGCEAVAPGYPNTDFNVKPISSNDTDTSFWCPTVSSYNGKASAQNSKKKQWGYCKTTFTTRYPTPQPTNIPSSGPTTTAPSDAPTTTAPSGSPSPEPTTAAPTVFTSVAEFFADGGGVGRNTDADASGYLDCMFPFTIKGVEDSQGQEIEFNSCVNFSLGVVPYGLENGEAKNGYPTQPLNNDTNINLWCPVVNDRYNRAPNSDVGRRWDWGYCLQVDTTRNPTAAPVRPTQSPSVAPSAFVSVVTLYASGGGLATAQPDVEELVCEPFDLKNCPSGNEHCVEGQIYESCLSVSDIPPHNANSLPPNPNVTGVNTSTWCPINGRYNFDPSDASKRFDWGYCRTVMSTRSPTSGATESPTATSSDSPTVATDSPTIATDSPTIATDSPTVATDSPTVTTETPTVATDSPSTAVTESPSITVTDTPTATVTDSPTISNNVTATSAPTSAGSVSAVRNMVASIISIIVFATL